MRPSGVMGTVRRLKLAGWPRPAIVLLIQTNNPGWNKSWIKVRVCECVYQIKREKV